MIIVNKILELIAQHDTEVMSWNTRYPNNGKSFLAREIREIINYHNIIYLLDGFIDVISTFSFQVMPNIFFF